jgi:hypothetical protein
MERIEDLCHPDAPRAQYLVLTVAGRTYVDAWLPSLPLSMFTLRSRLADAWAVWKGRATAVQWPHQRDEAQSRG